jgi:inhibitor of KinA
MEIAPRILPAGDQAVLIEFGAEINPTTNRRVHAFASRARQSRISGIGELVPSYCSLLVYYDPFLLSFLETAAWARELITEDLTEKEAAPTVKEVPVLYGGEWGPDLSFVAQHNKVSPEEVIRIHTSQAYLVYVVGFSPGFSAMGVVSPNIQAPRLASPRTKVPAGSVGIGGQQTGVYAVESPGGWQLIGRTPLSLFNVKKNPPSLFQAGDYCHFYAISEEEFKKLSSRP